MKTSIGGGVDRLLGVRVCYHHHHLSLSRFSFSFVPAVRVMCRRATVHSDLFAADYVWLIVYVCMRVCACV